MEKRTLRFRTAVKAVMIALLLCMMGKMNVNAQSNHSYVDLGLPSGTLWATCNVGANTPEEYGDYFAWGETQPKVTYNWNTYQYCNGSSNTLTKYCYNSEYGYNGYTDNLTSLQSCDDAATANWGDDWRMPTNDEWEELYQSTTYISTTQNGISGRLFTGSNGNSLFLPLAGRRWGNELNYANSIGYYWSNSLYSGYPYDAWTISFDSYGYGGVYCDYRYYGRSIRPVYSMLQNDTPSGAINGKFTINAYGDQVYFSQGNLQYQASTNTWRFAVNQYDYVGADNSNISSTYSGWIDLFGWGTSGYDHGAVCYQPWSISQNYADYFAYGSRYYNLNDQTGKADWGYNAISNGGNQESFGWRTLKKNEWNYLIETRSTNSGIRYAKAKVNGCNGVVLLPDDWNTNDYTLNNVNQSDAGFDSNIITLEDWSLLETKGVVFLPVTGTRNGLSVSSSVGSYWSASYNPEYAYDASDLRLSFAGFGIAYNWRYDGASVRLVCPAPAATSYSIEAIPNPAEGGTITGVGIYEEGQTCTLTATPSQGYTFVNWTENSKEVSSEAIYSFTVTEDAIFIANFSETFPGSDTTQTIMLSSGWNWFSTYLDIDLAQLEEALGNNGSNITSQNDGFVSYINGIGWTGELNAITPAKMYKVQSASEVSVTISGMLVNPANYTITLNPGDNWIGYPLSQSINLNEAFAGANPMNGDKVSSYGEYAQYYNGVWYGELQVLEPGKGYIYKSNASEVKTFVFASGRQK